MQDNLAQTEELTFNNVLFLFKETDKKFLETDKKFLETDKKFQDTDKKFQDTDKKFQDTDKKLNKLEYLFTSQWGKLIESLVEGDLINLLNSWGIPVNDSSTRVKTFYNNRQYEFDIIAENGKEIVVVEVKTTLRPEDVKEFVDEMKEFKQIRPKYVDNTIYGAVAFLTSDSHADLMAQKSGLLTIKATGNSSSITNPQGFRPLAF
jgi:hypothetical protein